MSRKPKPKKLRREPWTPFKDVTDELREHKPEYFSTGCDRCYVNSRYEVTVTFVGADDDGTPLNQDMDGAVHLSIKRRDRVWIRDWRELQRIKNEICGPEREAVELYPAESRLVDTANQYHLWVLPVGQRFPFGYQERLVMESTEGMKAKQRRFEDPPPDLRSPEEEIALQRELLVQQYGQHMASRIMKQMADNKATNDKEGARSTAYAEEVVKHMAKLRGWPSVREAPRIVAQDIFETIARHGRIYDDGFARERPCWDVANDIQKAEWDLHS